MKSLKWLMLLLILSIVIAGAMLSCGDDDDDDDNTVADDDDTEDDDDAADDDSADDDDSTDDDSTDDDDDTTDDDDDDDDSDILSDDFESYTVGEEPGSPWTVDTGDGGTVTVIMTDKDGSGKVARLFAPTMAANCSLDYKHTSELTDNMDFEFDVKLGDSDTANFYASECKEDSDKEETCTEVAGLFYNAGNLYAMHDPIKTECATNLDKNLFHKIKMEMNLDTGKYSVKVNDAVTACVDLPFVDSGSSAVTSLKKFGAYSDIMGEADFEFDNVSLKLRF